MVQVLMDITLDTTRMTRQGVLMWPKKPIHSGVGAEEVTQGMMPVTGL
jgi:hypothetical protein